MTGIIHQCARAVLGLVAFPLLIACSVKEDRLECPVYVTVLTDRFVRQGMNEGQVSFSDDHRLEQEDISFLAFLREGYQQACSREYARAAVLGAADNYYLDEDAVRVYQGRPAGRLWAYGETFSAKRDEYVIDAEPHKQYCLVQFLFDGAPAAPSDYVWRFRIRAACSGLNIYTLEPLEGEYSACVGPDARGEWYGVIPRQKSNDLQLEVYLPDPDDERSGRTDYVIDLGARFEAMGYDWSDTDLRDVTVKVGFTYAGVTIQVSDWVGDDHYKNIEI